MGSAALSTWPSRLFDIARWRKWSPGLGMHPRYALDEEQRIWRDCGIPENHIRRSFGDETASLLGIRRNA